MLSVGRAGRYYGDDDEDSYPEWDSPSYKGIKIQKESEIDVSTITPTMTPAY